MGPVESEIYLYAPYSALIAEVEPFDVCDSLESSVATLLGGLTMGVFKCCAT